MNVPTIGNRIPWSNVVRSEIIRLDRFLLTENMVENWKVVGLEFGFRDISNYRPVRVKANDVNCGLKYFRVNNFWFDH